MEMLKRAVAAFDPDPDWLKETKELYRQLFSVEEMDSLIICFTTPGTDQPKNR